MQFAIKSLRVQPLLLWSLLPQGLLHGQSQADLQTLQRWRACKGFAYSFKSTCLLHLGGGGFSHPFPVRQGGEGGRQGQQEKRRDRGKRKNSKGMKVVQASSPPRASGLEDEL